MNKKSATTKGRTVPKNVNQYLAGVTEPARSTLKKIRTAIRAAAPKAATETISYGMPMFKYKGMLAGFAAFSKHCSLFPTNAAMEKCKKELKGYQTSKGTVRFPLDKPLPASLVKKLVKARVAEIERKNIDG